MSFPRNGFLTRWSAVDALFIVFAVLTVLPAFLMVVARNPVNGAIFMIISFVGMAALLVLLEAFFLAILQVLVYAGAIMVLFLFIIMLLDMDEVEKLRPKTVTALASVVGLALIVLGVVYLLRADGLSDQTFAALQDAPDFPSAEQPMEFAIKTKAYGFGLFTKYMLPFQMVGVLLLIAMIGVIVLSKKRDQSVAVEST
ncbi:MAG: NADH-quinone oxidoreductase subunit J [Verrucomicrobiota bacterium]